MSHASTASARRRPDGKTGMQPLAGLVARSLAVGAHGSLTTADAIAAFLLDTLSRRPTAFLLFLPYWLWVSYASSLNVGIWILNR